MVETWDNEKKAAEQHDIKHGTVRLKTPDSNNCRYLGQRAKRHETVRVKTSDNEKRGTKQKANTWDS